MIKFNNGIMRLNGRWFNYTPPPPPPIYYVHTHGIHGDVSSIPTSGTSGTEVTLSNTPEEGYRFDSYSITGATLKNANQFDIVNSDVYVEGNFSLIPLPANIVRVRTSDGNPPNKNSLTTYETATLVSGTTNVYDVYKSGTSFYRLLYHSDNIVEVLGANTTGITNMNGMFQGCTALTTVPLFDTSSVTMMYGMFSGCTALTPLPLFDTSNVTNMDFMFNACASLTSVPLFDTSSVTTMVGMLQKCSSLTSIPLFNTSSVTTMEYMFYYCTSLSSVPLFNTSSVTSMNNMFDNCSSLTSVPLFDTSKVTQMAYMLQNCSSLTSVPLFNTSNATTMYAMFKDCTKVQSGALALYQQASTQTTPPSYHTQTFRNCGRDTTTGAAELAQIPSSWK